MMFEHVQLEIIERGDVGLDAALWNRNIFTVPVPIPTFEKLWFRFRFLLWKSYGSDSGSSSLSRL